LPWNFHPSVRRLLVNHVPVADRSDLVVSLSPSRLATACAARGWSYKELARRSKLSRPTIAAARKGVGVRPLTVYKILRAFQESPAADHALELLETL
jgi:hypothetical protein